MNLFCTCGRGTELFAVVEISRLLRDSLDMVSFRDGKVFFSVATGTHFDSAVRCLLNLKSVERIFVSVLSQSDMKLTSRKQAISKLKTELQQIDSSKWESCLKLWNILRADDEKKQTFSASKNDNDDIGQDVALDIPSDESALKCSRKRQHGEMTFRVSAKCSGELRFWFDSQTLSRLVGCEIARINGWTPELRRPKLEIYVQLNRDGLTIGLPCTKNSLSIRPYMQKPGLRTTICSIMVSLLPAQSGMVLLDPMCGQGTILIEAAKIRPDILCIGSDRDIQQCIRAVTNISHSEETARIQLLQADVSSLPLPNESIDAIVCDIPFGVKHKVAFDVEQMYRSMLASIDRVLRSQGTIILLCGEHLKERLLSTVAELFSSKSQTVCSDCEEGVLPEPTGTQFISSEKEETAESRVESINSRHQGGNTAEYEIRSDRLSDGVLSSDDGNQNDSESRMKPLKNGSSQTVSDITVSSVLQKALGGSSIDLQTRIKLHKILALTENSLRTGQTSCLAKTMSKFKDERSIWVEQLVHYVKLGETHAYICVFIKTNAV